MGKTVFSLAVILLALGSIAPTILEIRARTWLNLRVTSGNASVDELVRGMDHPSQHVRRRAVDALGQRDELSDREIQSIVATLEQPELCGQAANSLAKIGVAAVPALIEALSHESSRTRQEAAIILGRIGRPASSAVDSLIAAMLNDKDDMVRYRSAESLGKVGEASEDLVSAIHKTLSNGPYRARIEAAYALRNLTPAADMLVQTLRKSLVDDGHPRVRREVAIILGDRGAEAAAATPELLAAYLKRAQSSDPIYYGFTDFSDDSDPLKYQTVNPDWLRGFRVQIRRDGYRDEFDWALRQMGVAIIPFLTEEMTNQNEVTRRLACLRCGDFGNLAKSAAPAILRELDDENPEIRASAAYNLGRVVQGTANAKEMVAPLILALDDQSIEVRRAAVIGLGLIGPVAQSAISAIQTAGQDEDLRAIATAAIKQIRQTDQAPAVP
jgi:HEAT repeat protein